MMNLKNLKIGQTVVADTPTEKRNLALFEAAKNRGTKGKTGEGSRGGKVIGHTSSGKPIYDSHNHPAHTGFKENDHLDAMAVHAYLHKKGRAESKEEGKKHEESTRRPADAKHLPGKIMQKFEEERTAEHGKKLVSPEFR